MTEHAQAEPQAAPKPDAPLRQRVEQAFEDGDVYRLADAVRDLLHANPGRTTDRFLRNLLERAGSRIPGLRRCKVALLSSFSIEFVHDTLVAQGLASGVAIDIYQAAFGSYRQEILDGASLLYSAAPDVVILAVEGEAWTPLPYSGYFEAPENASPAVDVSVQQELADLIKAFRARCTSPILVHNIALPDWRKLGIYDPKASTGQGRLISNINDAIARAARDATDVHVVDYAALVNRHGALRWYDERMRLFAGAPIAGGMQSHLAAEYVKYIAALLGMTRKCMVLDLDNTLWGGVVGEDGPDGIALGPNYPGNAFMEFQRYVQDLRRRGVIIAAASKNNPADVDEVLTRHSFMLLRSDDFAAMEINWGPKSESIVRLAERLSIGLEHMVLVDDNPAECEQVRRALPMVRVVTLPTAPEAYVRTLQEMALFDTLGLSSEDRKRGELYRQRAEAESLRSSMASVEDYYRNLEMKLTIAPVKEESLVRAAQLTRKTNQFNVTTTRYSEAELANRTGQPDWVVSTVSVKDRFGDNGIVGVVMAQTKGRALEIDTLLLSCRVIGRTVETAMLAHLCDEARKRQLSVIHARIVPTTKNAPVRDVFERHGFTKSNEDSAGTTYWLLDLKRAGVECPEWFS